MTRPIFFLSDFGVTDTYVGIVKAVMLGIAPDARIVDLTHDVPAQDVRAGAFALLTVAPYLPPDAVVLAVVDPGVGTTRRPIAVQMAGRTLVGPDNGLLSWVVGGAGLGAMGEGAMGEGALGEGALGEGALGEGALGEGAMNRAPTDAAHVGARFIAPEYVAVVLDRPAFWLPSVSTTFHGRDLFGPVAGHLARGVPLSEVGSAAGAIEMIPFPAPERDLDVAGQTVRVRGEVIHVDRYGNLITSLGIADLPFEPVVEIRGRQIVDLVPHFQAGSAPIVALIGSAGLLEIAVPNGSAAATLGAGVGAPVTVAQPT